MESWCFDSMDKGCVSNEMISPSDSIIRSKNVLMGWDFKAPFSYENSMLVPSQQSIENQGFSDVGFSEMTRKQDPHDLSVRNVLNSHANVVDITTPSMVTSNVISGGEESNSKLSSSVVDSSSRESSLIDLKLGRFGDNNLNSNSPRTAPILSSAESSMPAKRARSTSSSSQNARCQVYGCNKDLSSAKDYHKRHKVCDAHSKTARVIVNGIEQRFCQQCSRFHLLAEFDDGKRSCRKRLAGHNERRRKQFGASRSGRSLHSYTASIGSKFQGSTLSATSFICQDILPRSPSHSEKYGTIGWGKHIKVENGEVYGQKSSNTSISGQLQQRPVALPNLFEKQYPVIDDLKNTEQASTVHQGLPGMSESGCALSLLSSQSHNSSGHSSAQPLILPSTTPHYSMAEGSAKIFGVSSEGLTVGGQNRYSSYGVSSTASTHLSTVQVLDNGDTINSKFSNGILQGSEFMNVKGHMSREDGTTIDLLQLSSQLQRVENQRQSASVQQESEGFCHLRMT